MNESGHEQGPARFYQFTPPPPPPASQPAPRRRRLTKTAAGLAVVLGAGAGAAGVASMFGGTAPSALASTTGTASSTTTTPPVSGPPWAGSPMPALSPRWGGGMMRAWGMFPGGRGIVHGSFTVKGPNGAYETISTQLGTVQAVSSSSLTVKSADGFTQTYAVVPSTVVHADYEGVLSLKHGDSVSVQATVSGSNATAQSVVDLTQVQANRSSWLPQGPTTPSPGGGAPAA